jgi:hypothetical protein
MMMMMQSSSSFSPRDVGAGTATRGGSSARSGETAPMMATTPPPPTTTTYGNSNSNSNKRQLVRPGPHVPWSVDVVSAVPKVLKDKLLDDRVGGGGGGGGGPLPDGNENSRPPPPSVVGATLGNWACLAFPNGIVYVWQMRGASNLSERHLDIPDEYVRLYFPDLDVTTTSPDYDRESSQEQQRGWDDDPPPGDGWNSNNSSSNNRVPAGPLVALSSTTSSSSAAAAGASSGDHDSVHLYAIHPTTGWLILRKVTRRDLRSTVAMPRSSSSSSMVKVRIDGTTQLGFQSDDGGGETILSLTASRTSPLVVVRTSRGQLYWVTHIAVPAGLHVQRIEADAPSRWSRWFGGGGGGSDYWNPGGVGGSSLDGRILPMAHLEFLAVSAESVVLWRVEPTIASGHNATFHPTRLGSLVRCLEDQHEGWLLRCILQAEISFDRRYVHCIVLGTTDAGESRLYWMVVRLNGTDSGGGTISIARTHWLSRFALPEEVKVLGLVCCENDNAYAAFSTTVNNAVIVMVLLDEEEDVVQEVDLPVQQVPGLVPHMMERDTVTHGCYMMAKSGLGIRARFVLPQDPHRQPKRPRLGEMEYLGSNGRTGSLVPVPTLVSHLRSYFWESYQDPSVDRPMPPSLKLAKVTDLEQAIIALAVELQHKGDSSSYAIAIEWHKMFVTLLQDGGLYRSLSEDGKWKLFGVGQELAVFGELAHCLMNRYKKEDVDWLRTLQSHGIASWLLSVQTSELESRWPHGDVWHDLLGVAMDATLQFREEYLESMYDVTTERPTQPLWISHPSLTDMLIQQMKCWKAKNDGVPLELIESVVKAALLSSSESIPTSWLSSASPSLHPSELSLIEAFEGVKRRAISLLRMVNEGNDELAFDLCIQYRFFEGLCEISRDHEKKHDAVSYSLDPLFGTMEGKDLLNGLTFPQFVLRWHAQKGLFGHVINYGRHSVADLDEIMNQNEQLRKYRWIPAIRQTNFESATEFCLENCKDDRGLKNTQWALSMAKLTNKLIPAQNAQVQDRQRRIEDSLEFCKAQEMLTEGEIADKDEPLLLPNELVELAMKKLQDTFVQEERIRMAIVGLAVCNAMEDQQAAMEHTARFWAECLLCDAARWTEWALEGVGDQIAELREEALATTVFGRLLEECRKDDALGKVTYGRHIESAVIDRVQGDEGRESLIRVLRGVAAAPADSMKMQSMMVSSF